MNNCPCMNKDANSDWRERCLYARKSDEKARMDARRSNEATR